MYSLQHCVFQESVIYSLCNVMYNLLQENFYLLKKYFYKALPISNIPIPCVGLGFCGRMKQGRILRSWNKNLARRKQKGYALMPKPKSCKSGWTNVKKVTQTVITQRCDRFPKQELRATENLGKASSFHYYTCYVKLSNKNIPFIKQYWVYQKDRDSIRYRRFKPSSLMTFEKISS